MITLDWNKAVQSMDMKIQIQLYPMISLEKPIARVSGFPPNLHLSNEQKTHFSWNLGWISRGEFLQP